MQTAPGTYIEQVLADKRQVAHDTDVMFLQFVRRAEPRDHEQLRRDHSAGADDHLPPRGDGEEPPVFCRRQNPARTRRLIRVRLVEDDPGDERVDSHGEVTSA